MRRPGTLITPLACASVCLWTACAHYEPKPLNPAVTAAKFEKRSLIDPGLRKFIETSAPTATAKWPPPSWNLRLLTMAAFHYNADLAASRAKLAAAEAAVITAGGLPNPTFSFSPSYSEPPIEFFSPWTLGFTLDVPVETAGKRGYRIAEARHLANAARLDVATTAWNVRKRVRSDLLDVHAADLKQGLLSKEATLQDQIAGMMEDRVKAGQSSRVELQMARVAAEQTTLQLRDAQKQFAEARVRLATAVGVPVDGLDRVALSYAAFDACPSVKGTGALRREALLNRTDILGALSEYEATQSALQLEIAKQYPDIHLGPGYTWNQGVNNYSLGLSLTLPVLNQNQGPIAEAEAHRREAADAFLALQGRIVGNVDAAAAGYTAALRKLHTADALLKTQQDRTKSAKETFDAGASDRFELLQSESELITSELERASALVEAQQSLGSLEDALQRPANGSGGREIAPAIAKFINKP